jgi:RNA polymerase sigma factor (sigma-70 family)
MKQEELQSILPQLRHRLVALATRYLNDSDEAEDIVQDAMLKLWMLRKQLIGNVEGFAVVLVRNLALNRLRRLRRTHTLTEMELIELESMTDSDADRSTTDEQVAQLLSLIDTLPNRQRTILRLHDLEGMDYTDLAQLTGMPAAALRQTISRTRRHLRLRFMAIATAVVAVLLTVVVGYRQLQYYQLARRYEGSYVVVAGQRNDDLREIRPQLEQTLAAASHVETAVVEQQALIHQAEDEVLSAIDDPAERRRLEELLQQ